MMRGPFVFGAVGRPRAEVLGMEPELQPSLGGTQRLQPHAHADVQDGDSHCDTYAGCKGGVEVVFCSVEGGGHTWPGGADLFSVGLGKTTKDLSANDAMWDFFQKHTLH
jgi:poly(3-hydroxybutyrate) depolymerase